MVVWDLDGCGAHSVILSLPNHGNGDFVHWTIREEFEETQEWIAMTNLFLIWSTVDVPPDFPRQRAEGDCCMIDGKPLPAASPKALFNAGETSFLFLDKKP